MNEPVVNSDEVSLQLLSENTQLRAIRSMDHFYFLNLTAFEEFKHFDAKTYTLKVYNRWGGGSTFQPVAALPPSGEGKAYIAVFKYDKDHNLLEKHGPVLLDGSDHYPLPKVHIVDKKYAVLLLTVVKSGDYTCSLNFT